GWQGWLMHIGTGLACALPATLMWLMVVCTAKRWLARQLHDRQWGLGVAIGVACGRFSASLLASIRETHWSLWLGCALAGGLFAALLVSMLMLRGQLQAPGDVGAQLAELQARIRPHFLFNALNSAIALVRTEPARAERVLENLSDVFRQMLQDVRHASTLGQELELARRYLEVEQVRFGDRLRLQWEADPAANLAAMPALILQPLLENAIRHGVEPSPQGADVLVRTQMRGNVVRIVVSNTSPAGPGKPGNGMALDNVRRRLQLLHDLELRFSTKQEDDRFTVRIEVPMRLPDMREDKT
ncbi:MAG: histidine kinase, partial [Brachymonas sp.]|nr:histidine kinase [Brachymonas sp.]